MKIKIRLTTEQLAILGSYVNSRLKAKEFLLSNLECINLMQFINYTGKKLILCRETNYSLTKLKLFAIDINILEAVKQLLWLESEFLDPLTLAIYETIKEQSRSQINYFKNSISLHTQILN